MTNPNDIKLIDERITTLTEKKRVLLKMKKSERRGELQSTEDQIGRLKRWRSELIGTGKNTRKINP